MNVSPKFSGWFEVFKSDIQAHNLMAVLPVKDGPYHLLGPVMSGHPDGILICEPKDDVFVRQHLDTQKIRYNYLPHDEKTAAV